MSTKWIMVILLISAVGGVLAWHFLQPTSSALSTNANDAEAAANEGEDEGATITEPSPEGNIQKFRLDVPTGNAWLESLEYDGEYIRAFPGRCLDEDGKMDEESEEFCHYIMRPVHADGKERAILYRPNRLNCQINSYTSFATGGWPGSGIVLCDYDEETKDLVASEQNTLSSGFVFTLIETTDGGP